LPSGDGRRGGDFEMWFWLMPADTRGGLTINVAVAGNTMSGTVLNVAGAVIPGANVTLSGPPGTQSTITDSQGFFRFANLAPGNYTVTASSGGLVGQRPVTVPGVITPPITGPITPPIFEPLASAERTLAEVGGIGPVFRSRLEQSGINHPAGVASLEPSRLAEILGISETRANVVIENARRLLTS
jgi:hypothetical protein